MLPLEVPIGLSPTFALFLESLVGVAVVSLAAFLIAPRSLRCPLQPCRIPDTNQVFTNWEDVLKVKSANIS